VAEVLVVAEAVFADEAFLAETLRLADRGVDRLRVAASLGISGREQLFVRSRHGRLDRHHDLGLDRLGLDGLFGIAGGQRQDGSAGENHFHGTRLRFLSTYSASAPAMISMSSVVIAAWRLRLYWMVSLLISSPALRVALSIAVIDAPCSDAWFSRSEIGRA